jgi:hypothetical protein
MRQDGRAHFTLVFEHTCCDHVLLLIFRRVLSFASVYSGVTLAFFQFAKESPLTQRPRAR